MLDFLRDHRAQAPGLPALSVSTASGWRTTTRAELLDAVRAVADRAPGALGPRPGPVLVSLDGSADSVAVLLGLLTASIDVVCLEHGTSHLADDRSAIWRVGASAVVLSGADTATPPAGTAVLRYRDLLDGPPAAADAARPWTEPSVLQLTSGSTGEPRIARHPLGSILRGARLYREIHGYRETDQVLLPLPMAHSFGLVGGVFAALVSGAELLTLSAFSLSAVRSGLERGATVLLGTPLLYSLLVKSLAGPLGAGPPRVLLSSGGPMPPETAEAVRGITGRPPRQVYGSTETGLIACQTGDDRAQGEGSAGFFAPGVDWRLAEAARDAEGSRTGRLLVRTSTMLTGWAGTEDTGSAQEPPLTDQGYLDTNDLVEVSPSGAVRLLGRKNTFINVGGRKVSPLRVERIVRELRGVADVHVLGLDAGHEQAVHAVVVPAARSAQTVSADRVLAHCRARLSAHETPHRVHLLPALPRTSMGKVDRSALLAALADRRSRPSQPPGPPTNEASRS